MSVVLSAFFLFFFSFTYLVDNSLEVLRSALTKFEKLPRMIKIIFDFVAATV